MCLFVGKLFRDPSRNFIGKRPTLGIRTSDPASILVATTFVGNSVFAAQMFFARASGYSPLMRWLFLRGLVREARHWGDFPQRFCASIYGDDAAPPIFLDLPGMGTEANASVPPDVSGFVDDLRRRFEATVRKGEPLGIFAVSLGGMVALNWLSRFPQDFSRAVIVNTSAGDLSAPFERFHPRTYPSILRAIFSEGKAREMEILSFTSNNNEVNHDQIADRHAGYAREIPARVPVLFRQIRAGMTSRTPERIDVPTLFLASRADRLVDWTCSQRIAERVAAPLEIHESAGHDLPLDEPQWVIDRVRAFCDGA